MGKLHDLVSWVVGIEAKSLVGVTGQSGRDECSQVLRESNANHAKPVFEPELA
jgi:hypothetical protein